MASSQHEQNTKISEETDDSSDQKDTSSLSLAEPSQESTTAPSQDPETLHLPEKAEDTDLAQEPLLGPSSDLALPTDENPTLISSDLEASFFEASLWQDETGEKNPNQEDEKPLSPEEIELSFFSDGEADLLNEEDFFFPAQSSEQLTAEEAEPIEEIPTPSSDTTVARPLTQALLPPEPIEPSHEDPEQTGGSPFVADEQATMPWEEEGEDDLEKGLEPPPSSGLAASEVFGELKDIRPTVAEKDLLYTFSESGESQEQLGAFAEEECVEIFASQELDKSPEEIAIKRRKRTVFGKRPVTFHRNYRRFLVQLVSSLLVASPVTFWLAQRWAVERPVQWTLTLHTILGVVTCLLFYLFPYQRRRVTLDDVGVVYEDELRILYVPWHDIAAIHLHAVEAFFNPYPLCYARVITERGDEFCFSNFGNYLFGVRQQVSFGDPPYPIVDIRDADMLLALMVQQIGPSDRTPDLARLRYRAQAEVEQAEAEQPVPVAPAQSATRQAWFGMWAFMLKLGMKLLSFLPTGMKLLLKSIKPAYAGVSLGIYAVFFRWEFALLLCVILIFHELGHVWAMMREGMRIRGVFLIPFFGAATVTDDVWPSWYAQARVNLAGPLWGAILTALCLLAYSLYPADFFLAVAIWGALINLLNLMPVHPLDGGRILHAIAYSLRSFWGFLGVLLILVLCVGFALYHELVLLYLLGMIGVSEFFKEFVARRRADKMALVRGHSTLTSYDMLLLKSLTGINFGARSAPHLIEFEELELKRLRLILHAPPMRSDQIAKIGVASFMVAVVLFGFLLFIRSFHPHAMMAVEIFR
ncbi:MAG: site-2 protease family protein [Myxococcales bacterium]|nr:site-2 protease family protein [Myxococcales bacterium]